MVRPPCQKKPHIIWLREVQMKTVTPARNAGTRRPAARLARRAAGRSDTAALAGATTRLRDPHCYSWPHTWESECARAPEGRHSARSPHWTQPRPLPATDRHGATERKHDVTHTGGHTRRRVHALRPQVWEGSAHLLEGASLRRSGNQRPCAWGHGV